MFYLDIHSSMLLSELPQHICEYIYKNYSKKWAEIKWN